MLEKMSRDRVKGFLRAEGRKIVNGEGEEILLSGWGLGNWLLCEGYMWLSGSGSRFERPRRIEQVVREVAGSQYAARFWKQFRENYITEADIARMAEQGYNSLRIPMNWRVLMEDEPGIAFKEDGFALIDRCLDWCEKHRVYAILDLHGAPGGQTGANIDDCVDDVPRLFLDEDSWHKGIELWKELARRYKDRWIVGGYDLLNEPLHTPNPESNVDYLLPKLVEFYEEVIAEIRRIDTRHMFSIEGYHWASDPSVFFKKYDDNMVIHFHRYGCVPSQESYQEFLDAGARIDAPLWLGETGENCPEWYAAMYPMAASLGFGYNVWPWKKMACTNSPYSVKKPKDWDLLIGYTHGGPRPSYQQAQAMLDEYLENMKLENCDYNPRVDASVLRLPGCRVRGTDFDTVPGKGVSYSGLRRESNIYHYKVDSGMRIRPATDAPVVRRHAFDSGWDGLTLEMQAGEFAAYAIYRVYEGCPLTLEVRALEDAVATILQDGKPLAQVHIPAGDAIEPLRAAALQQAQESRVTVRVDQGVIQLDAVAFGEPAR